MRHVLFFTLVMLNHSVVSAQPVSNAKQRAPATDVAELIEQLSSPSRKARHAAEQALLEMGEKVLPQLKDVGELPVSARESLTRIKQTIERETIQAKLKASKVSYAQGLLLKTVVEQIQSQTNNDIKLVPVTLGEMTLQTAADHKPFWSVIDDIAQSAQIGWEWNQHHQLLLTSNAVPPPGKATVSDCVRFNVEAVRRRQNFNNRALRLTQRLNCRLDVEPRIHVFYATVEDGSFSLSSEASSLKPFTPNSKRELSAANNQSVEFPLDFMIEKDLPQENVSLAGNVNVMCAAQRVPCRFPLNQSPSKTIHVGQSEVMLELVNNANSDRVVCTLQVKLQLPDEIFTSHRLGMLHHSVWLETSTGRLDPEDMRILSIKDDTHTVRYTFSTGKQADQILVYEVPHLISEQTFEVRVEGITLPR